ncbi:MAG: hypothetical protein DHS20C15_25720 [Planctomycetota bacterium]|nr:MAG: hypothetical protein DHS20C15_25720 [Planctomycetota bacterium]
MRLPAFLILLAALSSSACHSDHWVTMHRSNSTLLLSESGENGEGLSYRALPSWRDAPRIQRTESRRVQQAVIGLRVADLDADIAESLGAPPWRGVFVERVERNSAGLAAGLRVGDVLIEAAGERVHSRGQLNDLVRTHMQPGEPTILVVERWASSSDDAPRERVEIELRPDAREVLDEVTETFQLESAPGVQRLTGLQLGGVSEDLSAQIWGRSAKTVLITNVSPGSPAYEAGLRAGDRVLQVDEAPVSELDDIVRAVAVRAEREGYHLREGEQPRVRSTGGTPDRSGRLKLDVSGPLGDHQARVAIDDELDEDVDVSIPILFDYASGIDHTHWSFLDFIFQFGFNYRSSVQHSQTREAAETSSLSLFPFGMFEFSSSPNHSETTLFWFITWTSDR